MRINMRDWVKDQIESGQRIALPIMTYPGLESAGVTVNEVVTEGEAQFKCIRELSRMFPSAAAVTVMDLSVEAEAFGSEVRFADDEIPTVIKGVIDDIEDVDKISVPKVGSGRTGSYIEAARLAASQIEGHPTFGGITGPFTLAGRLFDFSEIMIALVMDEDAVHELLDKTTEFLIEYTKAFKEAGANGVIIAEPAAGLLSPDHCEEFSSVYVKRLVEAVQDDHFMVVLHNCGQTVRQVDSMLGTGAMGLHFGNAVDMMDILPQVPENIMAMGNLDPVSVFKNASVEEVKEATTQLLNKTSDYKNFVLSSGCDLPPFTPVENINAFFAALEEFNKARA